MADLKKVAARSTLPPRREPYWTAIETGNYLGYRRLTAESVGNWLARSRDPDTGKQRLQALGAFEELAESARYDAASKAAQAWFKHLGAGGTTEVVTVKKACENYVQHLRDTGRDKPADDADARFKRWVYSSKLAKIDLPKLTRAHIAAWRKTLTDTVVVANPYAAKADQRTRERSKSSINRDMTPLRAALNHAQDEGHATTDQAWRVGLRPIESADGRRNVYLSHEQRRALISHAAADVATFMRGLATVPLRPGALAALTAGNFDARLGVLTVGKDKAGADRRLKLPAATAEFFKQQAKDKLPAAPLFTRADGKAWDKDSWKLPVKEAAAAAKLPGDTVMYALRHSAITDLVVGGLDLLTVAQLSGTSVAMIERHYGHLRADRAAAALAGLAL